MGFRGHGVEGTSGHRGSYPKELHTFKMGIWVRGHGDGVRGHVDMGTLLN